MKSMKEQVKEEPDWRISSININIIVVLEGENAERKERYF